MLPWGHRSGKGGRGASEPPSTGLSELLRVCQAIPPARQGNEELTEGAALTVPAGGREG